MIITHKTISPGVNDDVDDDDDEDNGDGATEVQTNFVSSQYFVTITKSKIIVVVVIVAGKKEV